MYDPLLTGWNIQTVYVWPVCLEERCTKDIRDRSGPSEEQPLSTVVE